MILFSLLLISTVLAADRVYYISADIVTWNYAPSGIDQMTGVPLNASFDLGHAGESPRTWAETSNRTIGLSYIKAQYREYIDASFSDLKPRSASEEHLGILGPLLRASIGDRLLITFRNNLPFNASMHPHSVFYSKDNEGAPMLNHDDAGNIVQPGQIYIYTWIVNEHAAPGPADGSSYISMYHSHVDETKDTQSGLVGPIIISGSGYPDVDEEIVTFFTIFDENFSWLLEASLDAAIPSWKSDIFDDPDFQENNKKHSINGYIFSNVPALTVHQNSRVRWYMIALGNENDLHGAHIHGMTFLWSGHRMDVMELVPASMRTVDMVPDQVGTFMIHCHTDDHIIAGMTALLTVLPPNPLPPSPLPGPDIELILRIVIPVVIGFLFLLNVGIIAIYCRSKRRRMGWMAVPTEDS